VSVVKQKKKNAETEFKDLQFHELAKIFPLMDEARFDELVEDIRTNGLIDPIDLYEGKVLDGRNRYRACLLAGVSPRCYEYTGDDPLQYVLSKNLNRRHLDESQRAMVAANIANLKRGGDQRSDQSANLQIDRASVAQAAEAVNVGVRSVSAAKRVKAAGHETLEDLVVAGKLPVSVADKFTKLVPDKERQAEIIATQGVEGIKDIVSSDRKAEQLARDLRKKSEKREVTIADCDGDTAEVCCSVQFAELAILQLERIQDWHERKLDAVKLVEDWIENKRKVWSHGK
jgi:ParB-like chromosome segregation protein Spo0J